MNYFSSNSISSIELTDQGDLNLKYDKGGQKTVKNSDIPTDLQKIKENMEKSKQKKISKEELEKELERLEEQRRKLEKDKNQEQKPSKNKPWGLIIGGGALAVVGLVGSVVIITVKLRKNRNIKK